MTAALDAILPEVQRILAERAGLAAESLGASSIAHAVRTRIAARGASAPQSYLDCLRDTPDELPALLDDLVVPETWLFRDGLAFRMLARQLDATRARGQKTIRILSVGCSTGEEVYCLAIAAREAGFEPPRVSILGADISRRSLETARNGVFALKSFREADEAIDAIRHRWFQRKGELWHVRDELRIGVEFQWANLAQANFLAGMPPFDVIFCRNVLIYFHGDARRVACRNLARLLDTDGLLFSAPAEARIISDAGFGSADRQCPFAFRPQDERPRELGTVAAAVVEDRLPLQPGPRHAAIPKETRPKETTPFSPNEDRGSRPADDSPLLIRAESSAQVMLQAAQRAANDGLLAEADSLCGQVLRSDPANADAYYLRGVVRHSQGAWNDARLSLEKALYLHPEHYRALVHMMLLAEQRGDAIAAANYRRRAQQAAKTETQ